MHNKKAFHEDVNCLLANSMCFIMNKSEHVWRGPDTVTSHVDTVGQGWGDPCMERPNASRVMVTPPPYPE